jgi:hypothetical protein
MSDVHAIHTAVPGNATTSVADLLAQIAALQAQNTALKATKDQPLRCKVSEKGALSVYGLGQWPVTLYVGQWKRLCAFVQSGAIEAFAAENAAKLSQEKPAK